MAYQSNLMGDFWRGYKQKRIGTGMPLSQNEMTGLMSPMLQYDAQKADAYNLREQQASEFNRRMSLAEQAQKDQANANKISGVTQLAMLPMAYQSAKGLGWVGGGTAPAPAAQAPNLLSSGVPTTNVAPYSAQGSVGAAGTAGGVQYASTAGLASEATGTAGTAGYGMAEGAGSAGIISGSEGGAGLLGAASSYAPVVGAGYLGGQFGHRLADKYSPIGGEKEKRIGGGIVGGAAAGAAVGSIVPGVGTAVGAIVGGIIGGISSLF